MRFGGSDLPTPLRVARTLIYLQCGILLLAALYAGMVGLMSGPGNELGLSPTGPLAGSGRVLAGKVVVALAVFHLALIVVLVMLHTEASRSSDRARLGLVAAEVFVALYMVGFLSAEWGSWLFGPGLCASIVAAHHWDAIRSRLGTATTASVAPSPAENRAPAAGGSTPPGPASPASD